MTNEQIVREAYRRYLHREPTAAEVQAQIAEAAKRGETVEQWVRRIATHFGDKDTAVNAGEVAAKRGRATPLGGPPEPELATPSRPTGAVPQYANPWDPVVQDLKAQHPEWSDAEVWRHYTTGEYTPQAWYPTNPIAPSGGPVYIDPNEKPDYRVFGAPGLGYDLDSDGRQVPNDLGRSQDHVRQIIMARAKIVPGAEPDVGVMPDGTTVSLLSFEPKEVDPVTAKFAALAAKNPNVPRYQDVADEIDINGRGYQFRGDPSPEEIALQKRFLDGDMKAAGELAKMRMARLQVTPKPGFDPIMKAITLAGISTGLGYALGPVAGPILGSALSSGATGLVASNGDWKTAGINALAGGAGGFAGQGVGQLVGGGVPGGLVGGATGGATSAGTKYGLTELAGGKGNPWDILISALAGGAAGGLTGGLTEGNTTLGSDPQGIGNFEIGPDGWTRLLIKLAGMATSAGVSNTLNPLLPGDPTHFTPDAPPSPFPSRETMQAFRNAEVQRAQAELRARFEEYNARRAEAMGAYEAKKAEYQRRQAEALERLRKQALEYLEQVRSHMAAPLPPVPVPQAPTPPPPPDPFEPSAAARGQVYGSGDFPIQTLTGDFPISQPGGQPAPETVAAQSKQPTTTQKRLPLNILQIQAALSRR